MNLQLVVPDTSSLETLSRGLEDTRRFSVVIESNSRGDSGVEGRLRVAGANP
jgi:hypothetical protein